MPVLVKPEGFPEIRGKMLRQTPLAAYTWLRVGGAADMLFLPKDEADLAMFMAQKPADLPVFVMGAGSNLLVRDGGIAGVVIRLGPAFGALQVEDEVFIRVGAAVPDKMLAKFAAKSGIGGLSFYSGIPGSIGGALAMNAGCYGTETADVLHSVIVIDGFGRRKGVGVDELNYTYRSCGAPKDWIFVEALFKGQKANTEELLQQMQKINDKREQSQPIREKTGGSTFKNPPLLKSWELIDQAGARGRKVGGAIMSEQHCNFMINVENASADDLEQLALSVRKSVKETSGIDLQWEIKRVGRS